MSNFSSVQEASREALRTIAIGEARGAASITVYAFAFADAVAADVWSPEDTGGVYAARFEWVNTECGALGKDPISVPQGKSLASQVSKFRTFAELGVLERSRAGLIEIARTAATSCGHNYKKTLAGVGAIRAALAKDPGADDGTLLGDALAAMETLEPSPKTATQAFQEIARRWDKMREGFPDAFRAVDAERPALVADLHGQLTKMAAVLALIDAKAALID